MLNEKKDDVGSAVAAFGDDGLKDDKA